MDYSHYKGYIGSVEYSNADNCLFGKVLGLTNSLILYVGNSINELKEDFESGIDHFGRDVKTTKYNLKKHITVC